MEVWWPASAEQRRRSCWGWLIPLSVSTMNNNLLKAVMASRKPISEEQLLKERLRSVSIDLQSDVEFLERRLRRLLWDLQEMSKAIEQVERCWGADIVQSLSVGCDLET